MRASVAAFCAGERSRPPSTARRVSASVAQGEHRAERPPAAGVEAHRDADAVGRQRETHPVASGHGQERRDVQPLGGSEAVSPTLAPRVQHVAVPFVPGRAAHVGEDGRALPAGVAEVEVDGVEGHARRARLGQREDAFRPDVDTRALQLRRRLAAGQQVAAVDGYRQSAPRRSARADAVQVHQQHPDAVPEDVAHGVRAGVDDPAPAARLARELRRHREAPGGGRRPRRRRCGSRPRGSPSPSRRRSSTCRPPR